MKLLSTIFFALIITTTPIFADETKDSTTYFGFSIGQDPVFGFYPVAYGGIELNSSTFLTYYGVFWTQDLLGGGNGTSLYTEFGLGVSYTTGNFTVSPSIGILGGNFQSGGGRAVIGDGIVPSLYLNYELSNISLNAAFIYWKGLREESNTTPFYDLIEYTFTPNCSVSDYLDFGLYFDHLMTTTRTKDDSDTQTTYLWIGPSITLKSFQGGSIMFTTGVDLVDYMLEDEEGGPDDSLKDYYKLVLSIDL